MTKKNIILTNRELSWLDFNGRVLEEAYDRDNPLFERLKFLAITASNLDEFFMVRVAGLKQQIDAGIIREDASALSPKAQLKAVSIRVKDFAKKQYECYTELNDELLKEGINIVRSSMLNEDEFIYAAKYYREVVEPVLTPLAIDASRPFPHLAGKTLNMAVRLSEDSESEHVYSIVQIPSILPRFIRLFKSDRFLMLEDIILLYVASLFNGYALKGVVLFRITRNGDLSIDEDADDLMAEIEKSVYNRRNGVPVRLEFMENLCAEGIDIKLCEMLIKHLDVRKRDVYYHNGVLDLTYLFKFYSTLEYDNLKFKPRIPQCAVGLKEDEDIFDAIRDRDILLHHPYESFDPVVNLIVQAADDDRVLAIKQTLYRVSGNSPIIAALIKAAYAGKQVTVLVELKARFDEENNIVWARALEQAGCHVTYGLLGLKVHCKALLIVRQENDGIRRYIHLGTGNYNETTAKLYTDMGLFTSNEAIASDVSALFNVLTGYSLPPVYKKLYVAPAGLRNFFYNKIDIEIDNFNRGLPSGIVAKVNSLIDEGIIEKLYEASQAGVEIVLFVRGVNGLRSKIEGLSDNITIISIIGRYLEHHRIYTFKAGGENEVYLSSADLMPRNIDRRIETLFPVEQENLKERILGALEIMQKDNVKARIQLADGTYKKISNKGDKFSSQDELFYDIKNQLKNDLSSPDVVYIPLTKSNNN